MSERDLLPWGGTSTLTDAKALLHRAVQGRYAIAAVNTRSAHEAIAALDAAQALRAPLLLDVLPCNLPPCPAGFCAWPRELAQAADVPVAISWEAETEDELRHAAASGATDAACNFSAMPPACCAERTRLFVQQARALGLSATAELPRGVTPEQAAQFAARTGADRLAAPLRTADVEGRPCIDLTALAAFRDALPGMALVLHGVHGLPPQQLQAACAQGVSRVSFSKDIQAAELAALQGGGEGTVWERAEAGVRSALLRLLPLCGCQNRA